MESQQPMIAAGTTLDVSGHTATVVRIEHGGVCVRLSNYLHGREVLVEFQAIENAVRKE